MANQIISDARFEQKIEEKKHETNSNRMNLIRSIYTVDFTIKLKENSNILDIKLKRCLSLQ